MGWRLLISWPASREVIWDYLRGSDITSGLKSGRGHQSVWQLMPACTAMAQTNANIQGKKKELLKYVMTQRWNSPNSTSPKWQVAPGSGSPRSELQASASPLFSLSLSKLRRGASGSSPAPVSVAQKSMCPALYAQEAQEDLKIQNQEQKVQLSSTQCRVHSQGQSFGVIETQT